MYKLDRWWARRVFKKGCTDRAQYFPFSRKLSKKGCIFLLATSMLIDRERLKLIMHATLVFRYIKLGCFSWARENPINEALVLRSRMQTAIESYTYRILIKISQRNKNFNSTYNQYL